VLANCVEFEIYHVTTFLDYFRDYLCGFDILNSIDGIHARSISFYFILERKHQGSMLN
jgi:hypothetical protein